MWRAVTEGRQQCAIFTEFIDALRSEDARVVKTWRKKAELSEEQSPKNKNPYQPRQECALIAPTCAGDQVLTRVKRLRSNRYSWKLSLRKGKPRRVWLCSWGGRLRFSGRSAASLEAVLERDARQPA